MEEEISSFLSENKVKVLQYFADQLKLVEKGFDVEKISQFITEKLKSYEIEYQIDSSKNIICEISSNVPLKKVVALHTSLDSTKIGDENAKIEIIKNESKITFRSEKSNFGASSLFGVATMLAYVSDIKTREHGLIILFFTRNDEKNIDGTRAIPKWPTLSYNVCINLNGFSGDSLFIGGPCGKNINILPHLEFTLLDKDKYKMISASCTDMKGGVVDCYKGNAIQWCAHVLSALTDQIEYHIASIESGETDYTMAASYHMKIIVPAEQSDQAIELMHAAHMDCVMQYIRADRSEFASKIEETDLIPSLSAEQSVNIVDMLMLLPNAVIVNSPVYNGFETASTIGKCTITQNKQEISMQLLAMAQGGLTDLLLKVKSAVRHSGIKAEVVECGYFPQWGPKRRGFLANTLSTKSEEVFGTKLPFGLQSIPLAPSILFDLGYDEASYASVGPKIENFRAKGESVDSDEIEKWYSFVEKCILKIQQ